VCGVVAGVLVLLHFFEVPKELPPGADPAAMSLFPSAPLDMAALALLVISLALTLNRKTPYHLQRTGRGQAPLHHEGSRRLDASCAKILCPVLGFAGIVIVMVMGQINATMIVAAIVVGFVVSFPVAWAIKNHMEKA